MWSRAMGGVESGVVGAVGDGPDGQDPARLDAGCPDGGVGGVGEPVDDGGDCVDFAGAFGQPDVFWGHGGAVPCGECRLALLDESHGLLVLVAQAVDEGGVGGVVGAGEAGVAAVAGFGGGSMQ